MANDDDKEIVLVTTSLACYNLQSSHILSDLAVDRGGH